MNKSQISNNLFVRSSLLFLWCALQACQLVSEQILHIDRSASLWRSKERVMTYLRYCLLETPLEDVVPKELGHSQNNHLKGSWQLRHCPVNKYSLLIEYSLNKQSHFVANQCLCITGRNTSLQEFKIVLCGQPLNGNTISMTYRT